MKLKTQYLLAPLLIVFTASCKPSGDDEDEVPDFSGVFNLLVTYEENDCNPAREGAVDAEYALVYRSGDDFFMIIVGDSEPTLEKIELDDDAFSYSKLSSFPSSTSLFPPVSHSRISLPTGTSVHAPGCGWSDINFVILESSTDRLRAYLSSYRPVHFPYQAVCLCLL